MISFVYSSDSFSLSVYFHVCLLVCLSVSLYFFFYIRGEISVYIKPSPLRGGLYAMAISFCLSVA